MPTPFSNTTIFKPKHRLSFKQDFNFVSSIRWLRLPNGECGTPVNFDQASPGAHLGKRHVARRVDLGSHFYVVPKIARLLSAPLLKVQLLVVKWKAQ